MSELPNPDVATFRLVKGGEAGVGLKLSDLFDKEFEFKLFGLFKVKGVIKAFPVKLINKLITVQGAIDKQVQEEIDKAKMEANVNA